MQAGDLSAMRALPKIIASVNRTAAANGTPISAKPKVVARAAARLAHNPPALQRLSAPSPRARHSWLWPATQLAAAWVPPVAAMAVAFGALGAAGAGGGSTSLGPPPSPSPPT